MTTENAHRIAKALFDLRVNVSAARAILSQDRAIARPLPDQAISDTELWDDALTVGKARARPLLHAALECALDLMGAIGGGRSESELGALAVAIKETIEWACRCLNEHGAAPNNYDRMAASYAVDAAWQLTAATLRVFSINRRFERAARAR